MSDWHLLGFRRTLMIQIIFGYMGNMFDYKSHLNKTVDFQYNVTIYILQETKFKMMLVSSEISTHYVRC